MVLIVKKGDRNKYENYWPISLLNTLYTVYAAMVQRRLAEKLDTWTGSFEELRQWTLDKTSEMRGSREGQEGLSSFLERRPPDWASRDGEG